jgi:hypothetical protein
LTETASRASEKKSLLDFKKYLTKKNVLANYHCILFSPMKISTPNSFGFIVSNHPVLKVNLQSPVSARPPHFDVKKKEQKKKA